MRVELLCPLLESIAYSSPPTMQSLKCTPEVAYQNSESLRPIIHGPTLERPNTDIDPAAIFHVDTSVKNYVPELKEVANIQPLRTDMAVVRGGSFFRGSVDGNRDEMPRHLVTLSSFAIDIHPVTNEQFVRFLEVMGGEKDSNHNDIIRLRDSRVKRSGGRLSIESGYAKHPVVGVTWYGAIAYAKWVGKRLPTEAEWEIAARGGKENALYPTGDDIEKSQANFFSSDTTSVMSYAPNAIGLYDMAGNVYEWCQDWYGYNYYETSIQEPENPQGPLQGVYRVLRGGCWKSLKEDLRCSRRHRNNPGTVNGTYGFRCAADVG
jgi:formylglycine-generating enzyme required for sulfatase activity